MKGNIPSTLNSQSWKINFWEIGSWIKEFLESVREFFSFDIYDILNNDNEKDLEDFMMIMTSWMYPKMADNLKEPFFRKQSSAGDEWCFKVNDFVNPWVLKKLYDSNMVDFWTNWDDNSFYHLETTYAERRLRIIFHNSAYYKNREKLSFEELVEKNEPVRICWY